MESDRSGLEFWLFHLLCGLRQVTWVCFRNEEHSIHLPVSGAEQVSTPSFQALCTVPGTRWLLEKASGP